MARNTAALTLFVTCAIALVAAACDGALGSGESKNSSRDPLKSPDFLTPVAQARSTGIQPYWLGSRFGAGGLLYEVSPLADLSPTATAISFDYAADVGVGYTGASVELFGPSSTGPVQLRQNLSRVAGATAETVQVGPWSAELFSLPTGTRPVNQLWLFFTIEDTTAVIHAASGSTGVPGTDVSPLIDKDLLIQVVAENLQPIP